MCRYVEAVIGGDADAGAAAADEDTLGDKAFHIKQKRLAAAADDDDETLGDVASHLKQQGLAAAAKRNSGSAGKATAARASPAMGKQSEVAMVSTHQPAPPPGPPRAGAADPMSINDVGIPPSATATAPPRR